MDENYETIWQVPPITIEGMLEHVRMSNDMMVNELLTIQYAYLDNLGIDYLQNDGANDMTLINFIKYVNDNYLPIINISTILETPYFIQIMGKFIYSFICIDCIKQLIPKIMTSLDFKQPSQLCTIDDNILREQLIRIIKMKIDILKDMLTKAYNTNVHKSLLKWIFYVDLCDNDLSQFIINYLIPVCQKYEVDIISNS